MELSINNATIGYAETALINKVNLTMHTGEIVLLIGNNGMGKTTLIKSILNQTSLLSGNICINNQSVAQLTYQEIAKKIAIVFSSKNLPNHYTTRDLIALGRFIHYPYYFELTPKDRTLVQTTINQLGLQEFERTPLEHLSDGNIQKAFIGRALVQESPIMILDEPTAHLDETNKIALYTLLRTLAKEQGKIILFSSHDWRLAKSFTDKIAYIKNQEVQFDDVENIIKRNQELHTPIQF